MENTNFKKERKVMKVNVMNIVKIVVGLSSIGIGLAQNYLDKKDLDTKIAEKVAEEVQKVLGKQ